jgi:HEAT repeat protein
MRTVVFVLLGVLVCSFNATAQTTCKTAAVGNTMLAMLECLISPTPEERKEAFYALLAHGTAVGEPDAPSAVLRLLRERRGRADEISRALITALERENQLAMVHSAQHKLPTLQHPQQNYYMELIAVVAALGDTRGVNALAATITSGPVVLGALGRMGSPAVDAVLAKAASGDEPVRAAAVTVLATMVIPGNRMAVRHADVARIEAVLLTAAEDKVPAIRITAVEGVGRLKNPNHYALLQRLATRDPYRDERGRYPVREAAKMVIQKYW